MHWNYEFTSYGFCYSETFLYISVYFFLVAPFSACHELVDPQPFYTSCVFDVCVTNLNVNQLCGSIKDYVKNCRAVRGNPGEWWNYVRQCGRYHYKSHSDWRQKEGGCCRPSTPFSKNGFQHATSKFWVYFHAESSRYYCVTCNENWINPTRTAHVVLTWHTYEVYPSG